MNPFVARLKDKVFRRRFRESTHFTSWGEVTGVMSKENRFESRDFFWGVKIGRIAIFFLCGSCCRWAECRQVLYVIPWGVPSKIIMADEIWLWKSNIYNKLGTIGSVSLKKSWKWKIGPSRQSLPQKLGAVCVCVFFFRFEIWQPHPVQIHDDFLLSICVIPPVSFLTWPLTLYLQYIGDSI